MVEKHQDKEALAFNRTLRAAEMGEASAQFNVGLMYANGMGVAQDFDKALQWYRKAAERGYAPAQTLLAGKYATGQGVPQDYFQAMSWYLRAGEKGYAKAIHKLGELLSTGPAPIVAEFYQKAALKGHAEAQVMLGDMLLNTFRLGGLVVAGSVKRDGVAVDFQVTDTAQTVPVHFEGILPDLFKEGKGAVAQGRLNAQGEFVATEVLAKHDENYMPPEAQHAVDVAHGKAKK